MTSPLLCESRNSLRQSIEAFLRVNEADDWSTVDLVKNILKFYSLANVPTDIAAFSCSYKAALQVYANVVNPDDKSIEAMKRLKALPDIMKAPAIKDLFYERFGVDSTRTNMRSQAVEEIDRETIGTTSTRKPFGEASEIEQMQILIEEYGTDGVLDLTKVQIPRRFSRALTKIKKALGIPLAPAVTLDERRVLLRFSKCQKPDDVEDLLECLFTRRRPTSNISYLRAAIEGLHALWSSGRLQSATNNEGWFRSNLYSFLWDRLFLQQDFFFTKRAECYSAVIKELQAKVSDTIQQRVNFILHNTNDGSDCLSSGEIPDGKPISADLQKGRDLLTLWMVKLGSVKFVSELEVATCQWQGRKLVVFGTKMVNANKFVVYIKASLTIPATEGHYADAASALLVLLSLGRHVALNYAKYTSMLEAKQQQELQTLVVTNNEDIQFRDNSIEEAEAEEAPKEWDFRKEGAILSKCKRITHPKNVITDVDWGKMLTDDKNEQTSTHCSKKQRTG